MGERFVSIEILFSLSILGVEEGRRAVVSKNGLRCKLQNVGVYAYNRGGSTHH